MMDLVYLFIKIIGIKGQLSMSNIMELMYFVFCIYRVIYLTDLSAGFITTKNHTTVIFFIFKYLIILFENDLAGPVNLVKLA